MVPPPLPDDRSAVTLRYWASARAAAGVDADVVDVEGPTSVEDLLEEVRRRHDSVRFRDVVGCCSLLVGDRPVTSEDLTRVVVRPGETVELLPPFAGG